MSPIEELFASALRKRSLPFEAQPHVVGVGHPDFRVYRRTDSENIQELFVECDGAEFHVTVEQFAEDRRRDRELMKLGAVCVRFTGSEIVKDADLCVTVCEQILRHRPQIKSVAKPRPDTPKNWRSGPVPPALEMEILKHVFDNPVASLEQLERLGVFDAITHPTIQICLAMARISIRDGLRWDPAGMLCAAEAKAPGLLEDYCMQRRNEPPDPSDLTDLLLKLLEKYRDEEWRRIARIVPPADPETLARLKRLSDRIAELSPSRQKHQAHQ